MSSASEPKPGQPYVVVPGDTISRIAFRAFGDARRYKEVCEFNRHTIGPNPTRLQPGVTLQIPNPDYLSAPRSLFGRGTVGKTFSSQSQAENKPGRENEPD